MKIYCLCLVILLNDFHVSELKVLNFEFQKNVLHHSVDGRIAGGVKPTKVPQHVAFIGLYDKIVGDYVACAGALIAKDYVLTSKRCLLNKNGGYLIVGESDIKKSGPNPKMVHITDLTAFRVHGLADLGLIKLPKGIDGVHEFAKLPLRSEWRRTYRGIRGDAYGYGVSDDPKEKDPGVLRMVSSNVIRCSSCNWNSWNETCFNGATGKGTCSGDSGAPLFINNTLVGIATQVNEPCGNVGENRFILVNRLLDWIADITGILIP